MIIVIEPELEGRRHLVLASGLSNRINLNRKELNSGYPPARGAWENVEMKKYNDLAITLGKEFDIVSARRVGVNVNVTVRRKDENSSDT